MVLRVELDVDNVPFVQLGKYLMRLDLEDLNEEYKERAKNELRETPEIVEDALRQIKEFISNEPGLNLPLDDDDFLLKFLRPFKFYPDSAFKVLKKFYKFKIKHPKYGHNVTPTAIRHVFDKEVFVLLPTRTPSGARLMIINAGTKWTPKSVPLIDLFKSMLSVIEIAMMEPKTQVAGVHVIINLEGMSLTHIYQFSPSTAKLILDWVQECAPVRLLGIHIINQGIFFDMVYAVFKPFIGEKLKRKLHFHGTDKSRLCELLSGDALPKSLGGNDPILDYPGHLTSDLLLHYEDSFTRINEYGYLAKK